MSEPNSITASATGDRTVGDFLGYVIASRSLVDMVHASSAFTTHVEERMRSTYLGRAEALADHDAGSVASMAKVARAELDDGFPLFHAHTLVGLWGAFEACIHDLALAWLSTRSDQDIANYSHKVRVPIAEFLSLQGRERWSWLLDQIDKSGEAFSRAGVGQFEAQLNKVGLGGDVDEHVRLVLLVTKEIRNLYAHRGGLADSRFKEKCPQIAAEVDAQVKISRRQLTASYTAMALYAETVLARIRLAEGSEPSSVELPPWIATTADLLPMMTAKP